MPAKKVRWAVNTPDGSPLVLNGVIVDIDEETGAVHLDERTAKVVQDVVTHGVQPVAMALVPMADFAEEVHRLIVDRGKKSEVPDEARADEPARIAITEPQLSDFQESVDDLLRRFYSQLYRHTAALFGRGSEPPSMDELRNGPVGMDLKQLGRIAAGEVRCDQDELVRAIESIIELLFWAPADDYPSVPPSFWATPIGHMLRRALFAIVDRQQFLTVEESTDALQTTRRNVYRLLDDRVLRSYPELDGGQLLILRSDVDKLVSEMQDYARSLPEMSDDEKPQGHNIIVFRGSPRDKQRQDDPEANRSLIG